MSASSGRRVSGLSLVLLAMCHLIARPAHCRPFQEAELLTSSSPTQVRITIQPNDLVAIEGESAELNCDAEGEPEPQIEWFHNGLPIKSSTNSRTTMGGSIQFLDIRAPTQAQDGQRQLQDSDAGVYHCLAKNQFGEARSRNATLQVAYIREPFRAAPRDKVVGAGGSATFDCLPQAWPEPTIVWRRNGQPLDPAEARLLADGAPKFTVQRIAKTDLAGAVAADAPQPRGGELVDVFGSRLVISKVEKADEAKFSCLVETRGSHRLIERESPAGQLIVSVKPFFIEAPQHRSGQVGERVQMRCRMGGDPEPVISWRRQDGQPLSEKTSIDPSDKTLIIESLRPADQGVYICEGENNAGSARAMAQVQVNSRPKFNVQPTDQTVEQGARVQLQCSGEATPPPLMFWYKEGHRQLMFPPSTASSINNRSPQQQAPWPQAAALTTHSDISPATNKLFSMPISNLDNMAAQSNYFASRIYVDNQGTLNIINATSSDTGYYACALISPVGSVMAKAKLTIKQSPNQLLSGASPQDYYSDPLQARLGGFGPIVSGKYDLLPPPVIKMGSTNQTLPTNQSTILLCDVVSQVAYKIQWFIDNQPLQEDPPRITVLENGNLKIDALRATDSGLYTCVVTAANDQNMPVANPYEPLDASMLTSAPPIQQSVAHSCMLKVANPINPNIPFYRMDVYAYPSAPGPPYLISNHGDNAITIAWNPPSESGALPVKKYIVEHYDTSKEHLGWTVIHEVIGKETLLIDGLSSEGSHFFIVRAANSHGAGPSSAIAGPMRTHAGESRYAIEVQRRRNPTGLDFADTRPDTNQAREKLMSVSTTLLSLTPFGSNSIRLQWSTNKSSLSHLNSFAVSDFLEGYSIRYRAVGVGESLLGKDPLLALGYNQLANKSPASLPLVTSFVEDEETIAISQPRRKRDLINYYDYTQEFNEVRITDHNVEFYTINGLRPFTTYQFFVVPYFKDIDGVPSNILTAQTNEDRPSVAPTLPSIRPINNTAIRLLWPHTPPQYANGIIRGYLLRINQSDSLDGQRMVLQAPKVLTLPITNLAIAPLANPVTAGIRSGPITGSMQQYIIMYDVANLTYNSFYSIQVAGLTSGGPGPWSESRNFIMEPRKIAEQIKSDGNVLDDLMSQSFLSTIPNTLDELSGYSRQFSSLYVILPIIIIVVSVLLFVGLVFYRRNNQQVITWKKTISEHLTNKFYMPTAVDPHHRGPGSLQQNIYDHQHHLIYSAGSTHVTQQALPGQAMWSSGPNNGTVCINSSGTGSLSSHGGLIPVGTDPNSMRTAHINEDTAGRFVRGNNSNGGLFCHIDPSRTMSHTAGGQQQQIIHHGGDYYSVINNVAEYEEVDQQQRNNMRLASGNILERHQTGSSNSDTSCPSSVTRLLPNQNYNRDLLSRNALDNQQRHEMILQQQVGCNGDTKQPFITMVSPNDASKFQQTKAPLSPYATTNLMNQLSNQPPQTHIFSVPQMNLINQQSRQQQNYIISNGTSMDDSSKILMAQQVNGGNGSNAFRTLQRNTNSIQPAIAHSQPTHIKKIFMQNDHAAYSHSNYGVTQQVGQNKIITATNPMIEAKPNLYEHIEYNGIGSGAMQMASSIQVDHVQKTQGDMMSSSTSSGSVKTPPDQSSKYRRCSGNQNQAGAESEAHDLRVFSNAHASRASDVAERQRLNDNDTDSPHRQNDEDRDDELAYVDETTSFRRQSIPEEEQRARQLSKRKRKQHRNRLHNNNQPLA